MAWVSLPCLIKHLDYQYFTSIIFELAVLRSTKNAFGLAISPAYFYIIKAISNCFSPEDLPVGRQRKTPGILTTLAPFASFPACHRL